MALVATVREEGNQRWCGHEQHLNVFLRMWDGKTLCCTINPNWAAATSIAVLEQKVLACFPDESRHNFYFVAKSKPLNEITYDSLTWNDGVTVFVQYRNRGGCFIVSFTILTIIMMAIVGSFCTCVWIPYGSPNHQPFYEKD